MEATKILENIYLFNSYLSVIDLSFNQFLLDGDKPILVHTGSIDQTKAILPKITDILGDKQLEFVFVSHFESDECGGLGFLLSKFPDLKPVCSQVTARQLMGFDITKDIIIKNPGETFETEDYKFRFIPYPSEMHLWEGLMAFETEQGLLFSSDILIQRGKAEKPVISSELESEVRKITEEQIPSAKGREALIKAILSLPVKYILPGHGPCKQV